MDAAERTRIRDDTLMLGKPTRELVIRLLDELDAKDAEVTEPRETLDGIRDNHDPDYGP